MTDQILILEAIERTRLELDDLIGAGEVGLIQAELILQRLQSLYALLETERLLDVVKAA